MTSDLPAPGRDAPADGESAILASAPSAAEMRFESVLSDLPEGGPSADGPGEPDFFADLNLDQVVDVMTAGREQYDLRPFFWSPVRDVDAVAYRHEVLRDLEKHEVLEPVSRFAEAMREMRENLAQVQKLRYQLQKQAWFLDAAGILLRRGPRPGAGTGGVPGGLARIPPAQRIPR
ncbi:MAG: hypothetical protein M0030_13335 [Actinomycetota bacterium]|nr:hypothetical protein [Actinomycetota bacterium]